MSAAVFQFAAMWSIMRTISSGAGEFSSSMDKCSLGLVMSASLGALFDTNTFWDFTPR